MKGGTPIVSRKTLRELGLDKPKRYEIKSCPFCGFRAHIVQRLSSGGFLVSCSGSWTGVTGKGCGAQGPERKRRGDAVRLWNRRIGL